MIQETLKNCTFLDEKIRSLMIPIERVAHVQQNNSLEHALLVLVKSGYTAIPVLDKETKLNGVISKSLILDSILGLERIELDRLHNFKVADVMEEKVATMKLSETFSKALALSINNPFICMTDDNGILKGLLTRRSLLVYLNQEMFQKK
ncbi:CBS domain-containing protein [Anaerobacillus alkaliphilus]|uniref:CBS domain-containing protein n=1 Tax=Anaerobacillus alkaliphilus TaxID=1548597 RepID=A0A4Q0VQY0_9BACI|nr:cyclic-di-AMP-binding protein CbpB [Anaerobacillus alkaliphilus]RXI99560.1 CBS domain-containing protein [Anaerobacillus alkaliphilus]